MPRRRSSSRTWQLCFSRQLPDVGRFRASVYLNAGCPEMAVRISETAVRAREELGLPEKIDELDPFDQRPDPGNRADRFRQDDNAETT